MKKKDESKEELNYVNDVFETSDDDEFCIGQCYEKEPASKIYCKKCLILWMNEKWKKSEYYTTWDRGVKDGNSI